MRPNSRETKACEKCGTPIFFAVTAAGKVQPLNAEQSAAGAVAAYRGAGGRWLARTLLRAPQPEDGLQLELQLGGVDQVGRREHAPHPLERRFDVHVCAPAAVQCDLFAAGPSPVHTPPAPAAVRGRRRGRSTSPLIYNVRAGASHNPVPAEDKGDAKVINWAERAPRLAARRRTARPAAGQ